MKRTKYIISTDGHTPSDREIKNGKAQFRRIRSQAHLQDPIHSADRITMTFSDVNSQRAWAFADSDTGWSFDPER